jgi:phosphoglycerate dehydrogenase-like enzyme
VTAQFRLGLTGDFLNAEGECAYGDIGLGLLDAAPHIAYRFLEAQRPRAGDPAWWDRLYSMQVSAEDLAGLDGLIVLRPGVRREAIAGAPDLVAIGRSGAGYDKIDVRACTEHDVLLFNAPDALKHATASAALLLMLALAKRLPAQQRIARTGRWDLQPEAMGGELQGRTLGIVGLGHTGRELVRLVAPFAMRVLAFSPHADPEQARALGVELVELPTLLAESDFVSLHCRLTPETRGLLGARELRQMRRGAVLVNVGRGELVDEAALVDALRSGRLAGAGLDVFQQEPCPPEHPLLAMENVIATPHWLASTSDVWRETGRAMARGMLRVAAGEIPENVVNPAVLERPGLQSKLAAFAGNRDRSFTR